MTYENEKLIIEAEINNSLLVIKWKMGCGNLLNSSNTSEYHSVKGLIDANLPRKLLVDFSLCNYTESPTNHDESLYKDYLHFGFKKMAFIVPQNIFAQAALDALKLSWEEKNVKVQFFKDQEKARSFLIDG